MDLSSVISSILAGGLAGQLTVAFLNSKFQKRKDFKNWLRQEKYKAYTDLLDLVSAHYSRKDFDEWPDRIREVSTKIHLLHESGTAIEEVAEYLQRVFQHALDRKLGRIKQGEVGDWNRRFRDDVRYLRILLAKSLHDE